MRFNKALIVLLLLVPSFLLAKAGYHEPWGKDADLKKHNISSPENISHSLGVAVARQIINFHQQVISPVDGPRSHFRPSSSSYMMQAMQKHGFFQGFLMGCDRLMRENSDAWVYRKIEEDGKLFKHDPVR